MPEEARLALTLRVREGRPIVTDGPFAETREQLAGFCLLEANGQDQALTLAEKMPPPRYGCIEARQVRDLVPEGNDIQIAANAPFGDVHIRALNAVQAGTSIRISSLSVSAFSESES